MYVFVRLNIYQPSPVFGIIMTSKQVNVCKVIDFEWFRCNFSMAQ